MNQYVQQILENPLASAGILGNLIIIECLLSVDNAAVLATMVTGLPKEQRKKALRYGIIGAYVFRGICLLLAGFLVKIWWLKILGGAYLLWLTYGYFKAKPNAEDESDEEPTGFWGKIGNAIGGFKDGVYNKTLGLFGTFWATVALVEMMDLAFSIDNIFAVVAFTNNLILVCIGVFIGILGMRYVAQAFVLLMGRFPFLETSAYVLIGILGVKLMLSIFEHYYPESGFSVFLGSHAADWGLTIITVSVFAVPVLVRMVLDARKPKLTA
jgi:YkoY family integral membrane protein